MTGGGFDHAARWIRRGACGVVALILLGGLAPAATAAPKADLTVSSVTGPPGLKAPGASIQGKDTTKNQGNADAKKSKTGFYLSLDKNLSQSDGRLGRRSVPGIADGAKNTGSKSVNIPGATNDGNYFVLACADDLKKVKEKSEKNNCRSSNTKIEVDGSPPAKPSLQVEPLSPSNDATPELSGSTDGEATVNLFKTAGCTGAVAATTPATGIDSAFSINLPVDENADSTITAQAKDDAGNKSPCSDPVLYTHDSIAPNPPGISSSTPESPSSDNSPKIIGSADSNTTVLLYLSSDCSGDSVGSGFAGPFINPGINALLPENATSTIHATALDIAGNESDCSSTFLTYVEDSEAPAPPNLTSTNPASPSTSNNPKIIGTAEAGSTVALFTTPCTDPPAATGSAATLASPGVTLAVTANTTNTIQATATDAAGNVSACSSSIQYVEDSAAPAPPNLTSTNPVSPSTSNNPKIIGTAEAGSTVALYTTACIDPPAATGNAATLASPGVTLAVTANTTNTIQATATDAAGNVSACSSSIQYVEDSAAAAAVFTSSTPPSPGDDSTPEIRGTAEAGSTVTLYRDTSCLLPSIASGSTATFGSPGLTVTVGPNGFLPIRAKVVDGLGNTSPCSALTSYQEDSVSGEGESNGTFASAHALTGVTPVVKGVLAADTDNDFFAVTLAAGQGLKSIQTDDPFFPVGNCSIDTVVTLYSPAQTQMTQSDDVGGDTCGAINVANSNLAAGTYYVKVSKGTGTATTNYNLRLVVEKAAPPNEVEPNETTGDADARSSGDAILLTPDEEIGAGANPLADVDTFKMSWAVPSVIRLELTAQSGHTCEALNSGNLELLDSAGLLLYSDSGASQCADLLVPLVAGTYYARYGTTGGSTINYRLALSGLTDGGDESEPNDAVATADTLAGTSTVISGDHETAADVDVYAVTVPSQQSLRAEIIEGDGNLTETCESNGMRSHLTLTDSSGRFIADDFDSGRGFCSLIDGLRPSDLLDRGAHAMTANTYYLFVEAQPSGAAVDKQFDYRLGITIR